MADKVSTKDGVIEEIEFHPDIVALIAPLGCVPGVSKFAVETDAVAAAVNKRREEFCAGRNLARIALSRLGIPAAPIPRNTDRSPQWPAGIKGSISHSDERVMVAVTNSTEIVGIGIDVEAENSVDDELRPLIRADDSEASWDDTVLFSAKESVFKAVYPICHEFLEFKDVIVTEEFSASEFSAICRTGLDSGKWIQLGTGRVVPAHKHVITAYWI